MKKLWIDNKTGEFNWALLAVFALAAIFFYNVFTANIRVPEGESQKRHQAVQIQGEDIITRVETIE